jgi:predicted GIY-YIG superfamily endonuclease
MRYVYFLINASGQVEYVGETKSTRWRLYDHTRRSRGKFYGRTDLTLSVISCHPTRKESYKAQCYLQEIFGLESDQQKGAAGFAKGREILKSLKDKHKKREPVDSL